MFFNEIFEKLMPINTTQWILAGSFIALALAAMAGAYLTKRRARRAAVMARLEGRLGPVSSYDLARVTLAGVFAENAISSGANSFDAIYQSQLERDRSFEQGRFDGYGPD